MTGRHGGLATLLEAEASTRLLRFWCSSHQMDLKVKEAAKSADNRYCYDTALKLSVHPRKQQNLITDIKIQCPRDTTRWLEMVTMLGWMTDKRWRLLSHLERCRKGHRAALGGLWRPKFSPHSPLRHSLLRSLKSMSYLHELSACQQRAELTSLIDSLTENVGIKYKSDEMPFEDLGV